MDWNGLIVTIILIAIAFVVIVKRMGKKPPMVKDKGNTVFIMGECGAGKTAFLYQV